MSNASFRALCDREGRLIKADEPIAQLQRACGGQLPGVIAVPQLSALVERSRRLRGRASARLWARTVDNDVEFMAEALPSDEGFAISAHAWNERPTSPGNDDGSIALDVVRLRAGAIVDLDANGRIAAVHASDPELLRFIERGNRAVGAAWDTLIVSDGPQRLPGSRRWWEAVLREDGAAKELLILPVELDDPRLAAQSREATTMIKKTLAEYLPQAMAEPLRQARQHADFIANQAAGPMPEQYVSYGSDIVRSARHLESLLQGLASHIDGEGMSPSSEGRRVDLPGTARNAISICRPLAAERSIAIDFHPPDRPLAVTADETQVTQIILNLVGNALRYVPPGGVVRIEFKHDDDQALMTVSDDGPGIPPEDRERVFERFERLGRTDEEGTGLGLPIARSLARKWGGDLKVADRTANGAEAAGAILALSLPLAGD